MAARMSASERRTLLIDAAITVMAREGVPNTTTRMIVAEAGMQIGVFHYCFRSKDELILEVMKTIGERSFEAVRQVLGPSLAKEEMIRAALQAYGKHVEAAPSEHLLTYELTQYALRQPGNEAAAAAQYDAYFQGMEQFLTLAAETGGFEWTRRVDELARMVLAFIEGVTFQWLATRDGRHMQRMLDHLVEFLRNESVPQEAESA